MTALYTFQGRAVAIIPSRPTNWRLHAITVVWDACGRYRGWRRWRRGGDRAMAVATRIAVARNKDGPLELYWSATKDRVVAAS